jgi:hypothetical protein
MLPAASLGNLMQIVEKSLPDRTPTLDVQASPFILGLKANTMAKEASQPNQQCLTSARRQLDDVLTVTDYCILKQSTAQLRCSLRGGLQVFIRTLGCRLTTYEVDEASSVHDLKTQIMRREGIPIECQRLIYAGKELENEQITLELNVSKGEMTIHLVVRLPGG